MSEEYIKKEEIINHLTELGWISDEPFNEVSIPKEVFDEVPTYSFPDSAENNVGMSITHRAIAKVIDDYITNHKGNIIKQYTAYEIKTLLISDDSDNKGEWIEHKKKNGTVVALTCPKCLKSPKNAVRSDFCPNCGADMRGGAEE